MEDVAQRLVAMETRLDRLESLLLEISRKLEPCASEPTPDAIEGLKHWVTDFVALRLQQLVPETCEHPPEVNAADGPYLEGTDVRCTDEVVHRVKRIPIPFVRQMVIQKVADAARRDGVSRVDVPFFEQAATF
ncbi:MAG: PCP reductase family protein [Candidatus Entotheonellia bacterium]